MFACVLSVLAGSTAAAQEVSLDLSAGRMVYDPIASGTASNNASATLRVDVPRGIWLSGTGALPFGSTDSRWGALEIGGRLSHSLASSHRVNIGVDALADGFLFQDPILSQSGSGGVLQAIPFMQLASGTAALELRGGWRGHALSYGGPVERNSVIETGVRATYGAPVRLQGDARWVRADTGLYPFVSGGVSYGSARLQLWGTAGKWASTELSDASWGFGAAVSMSDRLTAWAGVRQDPTDPLYWNLPRRSWSVGVTRMFRTVSTPIQLTPSTSGSQGVLIQVAATEADGSAVYVAGDFNGWQAVPMERDGREWRIHLPLAPGVYHYAFRSDRGEWFVPESTAGRRSDGMGGFVAVLVVN